VHSKNALLEKILAHIRANGRLGPNDLPEVQDRDSLASHLNYLYDEFYVTGSPGTTGIDRIVRYILDAALTPQGILFWTDNSHPGKTRDCPQVSPDRQSIPAVKIFTSGGLRRRSVHSDVEGQGSTVEFHNINELGEEGWELVNIVRLEPVRDASSGPGMDSVNPYAYFKRQLQRQAKFVGASAK
jgi:hypothetical protein